MGRYWLQDIDHILQKGIGRGIQGLVTVDGWELRSRSSGGLDSINGLLDHHTASPESWDWHRDIEYIAFRNPYAPSPISQLYGGRTGEVAIIAAGAANHGGRGGAYKPGGPTYVSIDRANQTLIGKEMGNAGTGEQWPWEQIEASITVDALICLAERWGPSYVFAHKEYCGPGTTQAGRKIDPFGPWQNHPQQYWPHGSDWGGGQSNINFYRSLVGKKMQELSQEVDLVLGFVPRPLNQEPRILDTRGSGSNRDYYKLKARNAVTINVPGGAGKAYAVVNLTVTEGDRNGYITVWSIGTMPKESKINWMAGVAVANEVTIPLAHDGTFRMWASASTHVLADLVGFYQEM